LVLFTDTVGKIRLGRRERKVKLIGCRRKSGKTERNGFDVGLSEGAGACPFLTFLMRKKRTEHWGDYVAVR